MNFRYALVLAIAAVFIGATSSSQTQESSDLKWLMATSKAIITDSENRLQNDYGSFWVFF